MQKMAACFGPAVMVQAVVADHVKGAPSISARHQQTCNHASKQAAYQTRFRKYSKQIIYCMCKDGVPGPEDREPVSNGQICI
jgi:hypothetical protein